MKWFKHQSNARDDERVARLEDKAGLEGYGFYFKMLEIVAQMIDESDRCDVTFSLSRWGRQANITSKKFMFLVQCCADVGLMFVQRSDNDITVKIPNLLKHRDNHTKNLQAASKQELDTDTEKEADKEEEKNNTKTSVDSDESSGSVPDEKPKPPRKQKTPDGVDEVFDYWKSVMGKTGQTVLDGKRKARIVWALGQYGVETSKRAIDGCKASAWHMGENDKGQRYDDLTLIFRDASKVENFLEIANEPPKTNLVAVNGGKAIPAMSKLNQTNAANIQAWLDRDRSAE